MAHRNADVRWWTRAAAGRRRARVAGDRRRGWRSWPPTTRAWRCAASWRARPSGCRPSRRCRSSSSWSRATKIATIRFCRCWCGGPSSSTPWRRATTCWRCSPGRTSGKLPLVHDTILERLMRRYAAEATRAGLSGLRAVAGGRAGRRIAQRCWRRSTRDLRDRSTRARRQRRHAVCQPGGVGAGRPATPAPQRRSTIPAAAGRADRSRLARRHDRYDADPPGGPARAARGADASRRDRRRRRPAPWRRAIEAVQLLGEVGQPACVDAAACSCSSSQQPAAAGSWPRSTRLAAFDDDRIAAALLGRLSAR